MLKSHRIETERFDRTMKYATRNEQGNGWVKRFCGVMAVGLALAAYGEDPYVESAGNAVIETNYCPNGDTCVELDFQLTETSGERYLFGVGDDMVKSYVGVLSSDFIYSWRNESSSGSTAKTGVAADMARHTVVLDSYNGTFKLLTGGETTYSGSVDWTRNNQAKCPLCFGATVCNNLVVKKGGRATYETKGCRQ